MAGWLPLFSALAQSARAAVHNVDGQLRYMNIVKRWSYVPDPNNMNATGYPASAPAATSYGNQLLFHYNYYGDYVWKWSGTGAVQIVDTLIIRSSLVNGGAGNAVNGVSSYPATAVNPSILSINTPKVTCARGALITSMQTNGGLVQVNVASGAGSYFTTGSLVKIQANTGQANATGIWTITNVSSTAFTLNGSTYNAGDAYVSGGEAILNSTDQSSMGFVTGQTFTNMTDLVICKTGDEAGIAAGQIVDTAYVTQINYLKPKWLRWMDLIGVQSSVECDFAQRRPANAVSYVPADNNNYGSYTNAAYIPTPTGGFNFFRGGSDAYTCLTPTAYTGAVAYADLMIVQGIVDFSNLTRTPTLNMGGIGAKPILDYNYITPKLIDIASVPANGQVMTFRFNASWLNSGTNVDVAYTVNTAVDTSVTALKVNLLAAFKANASIISAGIGFQLQSPSNLTVNPRTPQAGALTLTYLSGPAVVNIGTMAISTIQAGGAFASGSLAVGQGTFQYSLLADAWIYRPGGMIASVPVEVMVDLCNRTSTNLWYTMPVNTKGAYVTAVTAFIASLTTGLTSGLQLGVEVGNEIWNSGQRPYFMCLAYGAWLSLQNTTDKLTPSYAGYGWVGLKTCQYEPLVSAAWTAVRSSSDYYILNMSQTAAFSTFNNYYLDQLIGTPLDTSNTTYRDYGGLNGGSETTKTAAGNRPVDKTHAVGMAPYWSTWWWDGQASYIEGSVAVNAPWLQASKDYTNGSITTAYNSLVDQFNGVTARSGGAISQGPQNFADFKNTFFPQMETIAQLFTSYRSGAGLRTLAFLCYEGGANFGMGQNFNNGINGILTADITALASQMATLSWGSVAAYTVSGTDDKTELATQVITMIYNFKFSSQYRLMIKQHYQDLVTAGTVNVAREIRPAHYGDGPSQWGIFPSNYQQDNHYTSYDAEHEWNYGI